MKKTKVIFSIKRNMKQGKKMSKESGSPNRKLFGEGLISAVSAGLFFILIGVIFVINQNLWPKIKDFGNNFTVANITNTSIKLPVPTSPASFTAIYTAAFQLALGIGVLEVLILAMHLANGSRIRRTTQAIGGIVFSFGAAYLLSVLAYMRNTLTQSQQLIMWYQFWAGIVILFGVSMIARAVVLIAAKHLPAR